MEAILNSASTDLSQSQRGSKADGRIFTSSGFSAHPVTSKNMKLDEMFLCRPGGKFGKNRNE
ncbi:hypothetical protein EYF80_035876 [Liparis tanakae]|uniref:Uncharacterized protein n=1 Tax=Liparis tanakae TaxID=230148 RepID=A0A4Z2GKQ2_9TELE|nr:hypothetical protein EYF80_035876 [Liparis tanakae]